MSPTCVACGGILPANSFSVLTCASACVDAFVDRHVLGVRAPASATPARATTLDAFFTPRGGAHAPRELRAEA